MLHDLRFGLKLLWKEKAFTAAALLTLGLCIGANTAIFTVLKAVVLEPLSFPDSGRLVTLYNIYPGVGLAESGSNAVPDYLDRKQLTDVFDSVALLGASGYDVGVDGSPRRIDGEYVTPSYFRVLRAAPLIGRTFSEEDAVLGKERVAILSYGLWQEMFAGDPSVLAKDIRLSGVPYRIVGVMRPDFTVLRSETRLWVPFAFTPRHTSDDARHSNNWGMIARLRPGVTLAQAQQQIDALNRRNLERFPKHRKLLEDARFATVVVGTKDQLVRSVRPTLYLLQGAVVFVLLIGCVNVANLMLVRSNVRMKELAIRFSLGAGRGRLGRQLLTESVLLATLGGLCGLLFGVGGVRLITYFGPHDLPRLEQVQIDRGVLMFSGAAAVLTGLLFGSVSVLHLFRRDLHEVFRQNEHTGTAERRALWTRSVLVVCQVSLAFVLLIGSGLLALSFARLLSVDPGFQPQRVLTARFSLPRIRYEDDARVRNFVAALLERVRALPGVTAAGVATLLPFSGNSNSSVILIEGYTLAPGELPPVPSWNSVDGGYFQAMGIPLLRGRTFTASDTAESHPVVIIDQFLARKYWPDRDPIGARIRRGIDPASPVCTIIGVVGSVKVSDLVDRNPPGQIYLPYTQLYYSRLMNLIVKTERDDAQLTAALRDEVLRIDPELALFGSRTMPERIAASLVNRRAAMVVCLVFAGLALVLCAVGIYGVLAYTVAQRTREIGIRLALGAGARELMAMILGQGLRLAGLGLALGIAGALAMTHLMAAMLYGVRPAEPAVFLAVAGILALVAFFASLIPSLRAIRIRPAVALRYE
jgi:predicted permease